MKIQYLISILVSVLALSLLSCPNTQSSNGDGGVPAKTGALTYGGRYSDLNIEYTYSVTVSPDGKHVYVAADVADAVAWFIPD